MAESTFTEEESILIESDAEAFLWADKGCCGCVFTRENLIFIGARGGIKDFYVGFSMKKQRFRVKKLNFHLEMRFFSSSIRIAGEEAVPSW